MQLRLKPRTNRNFISRILIIKTILILLVFFIGIFLLDKIDFPTPIKINKLYSERKNIYKLAKYRINCNNLSKENIANKIIVYYEKQ